MIINRRTDKCKNKLIIYNGYMNGLMTGWMDGWIQGWMDKW